MTLPVPGDPVLAARKVAIRFADRTVLDDVSLDVSAGEVVAIVGPSGAGKSTLLQCLGALRRPWRGTVTVDGVATEQLRTRACDRLRRDRVGFVFQGGDLVPELTIVDNVALPLRLQGHPASIARGRAIDRLHALGVGDLADRSVAAVSGGELQRAAIARALVHDPALVLADEPTGSLDDENADTVFDLLIAHSRSLLAAVVVVTHETRLANRADRVVRIDRGRLVP